MKNVMKLVLVLSLGLVLAGCSNPADGVPEAAVAPVTNDASATTTAPPAADGKFFVIGPDQSKIEFIGSKVTGSHTGGFQKFAGELKVVDGRIADQGNKVVIDTTSLVSDNDRLTGHLKSPDFFDVAQFPTATFETVSIQSRGTNFSVSGNLTLHGVTKQIAFPAMIQVSEGGVDVTAVFVINRFDFDIKYAGKADDLIRKEVVIKLNLKAIPGRAEFPKLAAAL